MIVDSHNTEFGYSLIAALPYAYYLHTQGLLEGTRCGAGSEAFYWFSPNHEINPERRDFANTAAAAKMIPNMWIHKAKLDKRKWTPPPMKEHFAPRAITFERPTVVICNRFNVEWDREPINFFDLPTLRTLFTMLRDQYSIVYVNIRGREELEDSAHSIDMGDYAMIADEFPEVHVIHDLVQQHGGDFNDVQCRVFAGCSKFICMNGGHAILCSYFGGENIIYTKECREISPAVNSFYNWYHDFGGSHIRVVHEYKALLNIVQSAWVNRDPLLNILVRCHNRPKGAERLIQRLRNSSYKNIRIIASYDNAETWRYVSRLPIEKVEMTPEPKRPSPPGQQYKGWLGANLYLNDLAERIQDGYVMYFDDDDSPRRSDSLRTIAENVDPDRLLLWRVLDRTGKPIPSDENFEQQRIVAGDISGIGVAFHSKHLQHAQWEPWRRGDYRVITNLSQHVMPRWLSSTLTFMDERMDVKKPLDVSGFKQRMKESADRINAEVARKKAERAALKA